MSKKRIVFLMSDTGGGHRAAAEAIREALFTLYGEENVDAILVDVYKQILFPLYYMPEFYPYWVKYGKITWGLSYNLSNTPKRANLVSWWVYLSNLRQFNRMAVTYSADVVVCLHSFIARPSMRGFLRLPERPPFVTVVTDLVSTHMFWYDDDAQSCLVPTQIAYDRGIECGMPAEKMRITGLPVHPNFTKNLPDKISARTKLGWDKTLPTVMMVAGGDGMAPLDKIAKAINQKHLDCQLVIIAGRNQGLKERLDNIHWNQPTHIYAFVENIPMMMAGADILVSKAGPATICEASIAELPVILFDAIPGQETGNIGYVVENETGVYTPKPKEVAQTIAEWLANGEQDIQHRAEKSREIARPDAVWEIAEEIWHWAHQPKIRNPQNNGVMSGLAHKTRQLISAIF